MVFAAWMFTTCYMAASEGFEPVYIVRAAAFSGRIYFTCSVVVGGPLLCALMADVSGGSQLGAQSMRAIWVTSRRIAEVPVRPSLFLVHAGHDHLPVGSLGDA